MNRANFWTGIALSTAFSPGCGQTPEWPPEPAALVAGEEACGECRMFVSDARFAVQLHTRGEDLEWFDDIGCLLNRDSTSADPVALFVHDHLRDTWVRGDRGHAVRTPDGASPMGYGWTVHASLDDARVAAAPEGSELLALSQLLARGTPGSPRRFPFHDIENSDQDRR